MVKVRHTGEQGQSFRKPKRVDDMSDTVSIASKDDDTDADTDAEERLRLITRLLDDKKAEDIIILRLSELTSYTDYFVICTGLNPNHVKALSEYTENTLRTMGIRPISITGVTQSQWVLMDYNDIIIHIFERETRMFYSLETLWLDAPAVTFTQ